jgi:hypothetical protein
LNFIFEKGGEGYGFSIKPGARGIPRGICLVAGEKPS